MKILTNEEILKLATEIEDYLEGRGFQRGEYSIANGYGGGNREEHNNYIKRPAIHLALSLMRTCDKMIELEKKFKNNDKKLCCYFLEHISPILLSYGQTKVFLSGFKDGLKYFKYSKDKWNFVKVYKEEIFNQKDNC